MRSRIYAVAALAPLFSVALAVTLWALGSPAVAGPCPSPMSGGC